MDRLLAASAEAVEETPGIGPVLAHTIVETLVEPRTRDLIERLRAHGLRMEQEGPAAEPDGPLVGQDARAHGHAAQPVAGGGRRSASRPRAGG